MNRMIRMIREGALVVVVPLLVLALTGRPAAGAAESTARDRDGAWQEGRNARDAAIASARRTQEKLVRGAYIKLMRYQRAYVEQAEETEQAAAPTPQARPADALQVELSRIRTGTIEEVLQRPLGELATAGTGRLLRAQPIVYKYREGPEHLVYRTALYDASETDEWQGWDGMTVADELRRMGPAVERAEMYTAYEVTATLGGERRSYRAFAVYGAGPAAGDAIAVVDNVLGSRTLDELLTAEFPPARAPWVRYIHSPTYAAVARQIAEATQAGRSPIPAGAPAGTLAGDGVVPDPPAPRGPRGAAKTQPALCVPITVGALLAAMPATGQPLVADSKAFANTSLAFAGGAESDLVALFQGDVQMTVTATNVQPAGAESQLRWKLERAPTDTVAAGLPALDASAGAQVRITPGTAGNFHLICFSDTNHNNQYDAGEELKVLRFAIVRGTVPAGGFCALSSGGVGFITASELNPGEMALAMDPDLTLPGMNLDCPVTLEGGGPQKNIGANRVTIGDSGNLRATSAQVVYAAAPGASAPLGYEKPVVNPPMLDSKAAGTGGSSVFRGFQDPPEPQPGPGGSGVTFAVKGFDPPGAGPWKITHPTAHTTWASTRGGYDFREFVAAYTSTFQQVYVVFATADWAVRVAGQNVSGVWHNTGSTITLQGQPTSVANMTVTVSGTTPQSADVAGMKVRGPSYAFVANRPFVYTLANLTAPTLGATAGNAQANLTWNAIAGATTYNVKRSTASGGPYSTVTNVTATTYTNMGLQNGTPYFFVVSAVDGALESPNSNQVSVTPTTGATQPPAAPKNLVATRGTGSITLTWGAVAGADTYKVKRSTTSGGPYTQVAQGVTAATFTNTGLTKGTTYYYVVSAVNNAGESANSAQASATP